MHFFLPIPRVAHPAEVWLSGVINEPNDIPPGIDRLRQPTDRRVPWLAGQLKTFFFQFFKRGPGVKHLDLGDGWLQAYAWASANHVVLGQVAAPAGSSELGALPALLDLLDLKGAIVTLDALGCQKEIVAQIVEKQGDYVISVKDNQEKLAEAVQTTLGQALDGKAAMRQCSQKQKSHGRQELRMYTMMEVPENFSERQQWPSVRSIGMAVREYVDKSGETRMGVRYYISSLPAKVRLFAQAVRNHWSIENQLHWTMDVSFKEDQSRARLHNAQANLGIFRRAAEHAASLRYAHLGSTLADLPTIRNHTLKLQNPSILVFGFHEGQASAL